MIPGGAGQPTSVGVHFISNPKVLEMVLTNGYDRRIDLQVLPPHNKTFKTYEELYEQFLEYYDIVIDCLVTTNNIQHDVWRKHNMSLVNSFLKPDCLAKASILAIWATATMLLITLKTQALSIWSILCTTLKIGV